MTPQTIAILGMNFFGGILAGMAWTAGIIMVIMVVLFIIDLIRER